MTFKTILYIPLLQTTPMSSVGIFDLLQKITRSQEEQVFQRKMYKNTTPSTYSFVNINLRAIGPSPIFTETTKIRPPQRTTKNRQASNNERPTTGKQATIKTKLTCQNPSHSFQQYLELLQHLFYRCHLTSLYLVVG